MIRFPQPLVPGSAVAVTAPSSGVSGKALARLDLVLNALRTQGYRVVEGECLRGQHKGASAPRNQRAAELVRFLTDPEIAAVVPPWGGELAIELLDLIDFEALRFAQPTWLLGYSDTSTLQVPLTVISAWATAHGPNLMDLAPTQTDLLTTSTLGILSSNDSSPVVQQSSDRYQKQWADFEEHPDAPLNLTEPTCWRRLDGSEAHISIRGRLLGGCLEILMSLAGTRYGDIPRFVQEAGNAGAILYLENASMSPTGVVRALRSLRLTGWFDDLSGVVLGRSAGPDAKEHDALSYEEALKTTLGDLSYPILYDVDIGHQPPQFTLINGAIAEVEFEEGRGTITQEKEPNRSL